MLHNAVVLTWVSTLGLSCCVPTCTYLYWNYLQNVHKISPQFINDVTKNNFLLNLFCHFIVSLCVQFVLAQAKRIYPMGNPINSFLCCCFVVIRYWWSEKSSLLQSMIFGPRVKDLRFVCSFWSSMVIPAAKIFYCCLCLWWFVIFVWYYMNISNEILVTEIIFTRL